MSHVVMFFVGAWIGSAVGVGTMCLFQINRSAGEEDENAETNR